MEIPLLSVEDLTLGFRSIDGRVRVLDGVQFSVNESEVHGLIGETGSGKSVTALSILRLLPPHRTVIDRGRILYRGRDLLSLGSREMERVRGKSISMVFQSPGSSLNPLMRIGEQVREVIQLHQRLGPRSLQKAEEILDRVGLPVSVMSRYPHELSGGMQQRVSIAMAVSCSPDLLIADEPTSSLDVTIQAQILSLLRELRQSGVIRSIIFITHDMGLVDALCDRVTVLYAGQVVETGIASEVLRRAQHPYTKALLAAIPKIDRRDEELNHIPGAVPNLLQPPTGCRFHTRCPHAMAVCRTAPPVLIASHNPEHSVACYFVEGQGRDAPTN